MPTEYPYNFVQVSKGDFIRLANGEEIQMPIGGLAVVFQTTGDVLGPYQSRHQAETEASCHIQYRRIMRLDPRQPMNELETHIAEAEAKAWDALSRYKFMMFGYWCVTYICRPDGTDFCVAWQLSQRWE